MLLSAKLVRLRGHGHGLRLDRLVATLGAGQGLVLLVLDPLPPDVILTEADLAPEAGVLAVSVAALALEVLRFHDLAAGLVLELVVLAEELEAEAAGEAAAAVVPDSPLALDTLGVPEDAAAGVAVQALLAVTNPGLAVVTDSSDHLHASGVVARVFDDTVTSLHHTLLLSTLSTDRESLETLTEITECAVLLGPAALVALHDGVAGPGHDALGVALAGDLLLSDLHLLSLFPLASFLFRHF